MEQLSENLNEELKFLIGDESGHQHGGGFVGRIVWALANDDIEGLTYGK